MANQAAISSEVEGVGSKTKSRVAGFVLAFAVLLLFGLANLPLQYEETNPRWVGIMELDDTGTNQRFQSIPMMAGWPLKYWVQYQHEDVRQDRLWLLSRLAVNLLIAIGVSWMVYGYIQLRNRLSGANHNRRFAQLFDVGIALAILLAPGAVIAWQYRIARQHRAFASQLARHGNARLSCWLPKPVVDHIPTGLHSSFLRLRQVHVFDPDQQLMEAVARVPTLVGLTCYDGTFDSSALDPLAGNIHFAAFGLRARELNQTDIEAIARLRWLAVLQLSRTNLSSGMLRQLDEMPLKYVDLTRTPLVLSELGKPQWSATVEELKLTRPARGTPGSLTIDGWPRLRRLSVSRLTSQQNDAALKIRLAELPSLEHLKLDRLQKHDCVLHNVPRLAQIYEGLTELRYVLRFEDEVPGLMWLSNLEVDGVDSLTRIECFAKDLETVTIRRAPNLRSVAIGSYLSNAMGDVTVLPANAARCQSWIDQLGEREGPGTVDFTALTLADSDLSPLAKNSRIRHLQFGESGVSFEQIRELEGMRQLESLDIRTCRLEQDQLTWLLEHFPKLKHLTIDGAALRSFDLTGKNQLRRIKTTTLADVEDVRIVDLPSLSTQLRISCTPDEIEIRNAPSLQGLAIDSPWPENATVDGLRDLEWFAGGGEMIDDSLIDVVLNCRSMDQLTLAYTSVTREKFAEIGKLTNLTLLALPGADIDDEITAQWSQLDSLWEINLDDTSVSVKTFAWLSKLESLRHVSLNRVPFDDAATDALGELVGVSELHLTDVSIEPEKLKPLLEMGNLETLNLSGWPVDDQLMDVLDVPSSLKHLILHNTRVDAHALERILARSPSLFVDLGETPDYVSDEQAADLYRRAFAVRRSFSTGWRQTMYQLDFELQIDREPQDPRKYISFSIPGKQGRINARGFRPIAASDTSLK